MPDNDFNDPCVDCSADQSEVDFDKVLRCEKCGKTVCADCAIVRPLRFNILDDILCKECSYSILPSDARHI